MKSKVFWDNGQSQSFSKIMSVVEAFLRIQGIRLSYYLDDWLALNQLNVKLLQDRSRLMNLLFKHGLMFHGQQIILLNACSNICIYGRSFRHEHMSSNAGTRKIIES